MIHFSTDCVFSGKNGGYTEDSPSDALDLYGKSKFLGEVATGNALTLRTSIITERPETVDCSSHILSGADPQTILRLVKLVAARKGGWQPPEEYLAAGVADTVCRILLGYRMPDPAEQGWHTGRKA